MNYHKAMKLFEEHSLFYAYPLQEGTLQECIQFDTRINTTIPGRLGLPEITKNQCEGIVIKAVEPVLNFTMKRRIFKQKNNKFAEVNPKPSTTYKGKRGKQLYAEETAYEELERYINDNRMDALRSKIGEITKRQLEKVAKMYCDDIFSDFVADNEETWNSLPPAKQQAIRHSILAKVRKYILNWMRDHDIN